MPVFNIWLIIKVTGLINAGLIVLIVFEEMPSKPQLILGACLSMIDKVVSSFIFLIWKFYNGSSYDDE